MFRVLNPAAGSVQNSCSTIPAATTNIHFPHSRMASPVGIAAPLAHRRRYDLKDVWSAIKSDRDFDYTFWIHVTLDILIDKAMRAVGYVLVCLAYVLITLLGSGGLMIALPRITTVGSVSYFIGGLAGTHF